MTIFNLKEEKIINALYNRESLDLLGVFFKNITITLIKCNLKAISKIHDFTVYKN